MNFESYNIALALEEAHDALERNEDMITVLQRANEGFPDIISIQTRLKLLLSRVLHQLPIPATDGDLNCYDIDVKMRKGSLGISIQRWGNLNDIFDGPAAHLPILFLPEKIFDKHEDLGKKRN